MNKTSPYYDLCVSDKCYLNDFNIVRKKAVDFGYRTIAINQVFSADNADLLKKKKKNDKKEKFDFLPVPINLTSNKETGNLKLLNRITVSFSDKNSIYKVMQSQNLKRYHVFAVLPKTPETLQYACDSIEADIITFEPTESKLLKFHRKHYKQAVTRGLYFELMYAPAILDSTLRKNIISKSHSLHQYGKSKNIIISSWAESHITLRSPYDLINLGLIFGLSEEQSKAAIGSACANVLRHAEGRRMCKALIVVENINLDSSQDTSVIEVDREVTENDSDEPLQKKCKASSDDEVYIYNN